MAAKGCSPSPWRRRRSQYDSHSDMLSLVKGVGDGHGTTAGAPWEVGAGTECSRGGARDADTQNCPAALGCGRSAMMSAMSGVVNMSTHVASWGELSGDRLRSPSTTSASCVNDSGASWESIDTDLEEQEEDRMVAGG